MPAAETQVEKWEGIDCFVTRDKKQPTRPIVGLDFMGCDLKDADLKKLATVKKTLKSLNLRYNFSVTDAGFKELACLENLEMLYFPSTKVGNAGLKVAMPLKNLRELGMGGSRVTEKDLKELAPLKDLTSLDLGWIAVSKTGWKELARFKKLQYLSVQATALDDAGNENTWPISKS